MWGLPAILTTALFPPKEQQEEKVMSVIGARESLLTRQHQAMLRMAKLKATTSASATSGMIQAIVSPTSSSVQSEYMRLQVMATTASATTTATSGYAAGGWVPISSFGGTVISPHHAGAIASVGGLKTLPVSPTGAYVAHYDASNNTTTVTDGMGTILWIVDNYTGATTQPVLNDAGEVRLEVDAGLIKPKKDAGERYHELVEKVDVLEGKLSIKDTPSTDDLLDHLEFRIEAIEKKIADAERLLLDAENLAFKAA